jgi:type II secretory pathway pseudopilin PulG
MIIVLVIIAILAAATMPAFSSAVNEHRVREDGHQLAMMVREAMLQSAEQHRTFFIDLTKHSMKLYAQGDQAQEDQQNDAALFKDSGSTNADQPLDEIVSQPTVDQEQTLDSPNKLQVPDPDKEDVWMDMPDAGKEWVFQPGELCPADKIRIVRDDAYLELDFTALTGDVETEKYYFP